MKMFERKTIVSDKVLSILRESSHALSINQIVDELKKSDLEPNKSTVYRILDKLIAKEIASSIVVKNGGAYFELIKESHHHHHHFYCNHCETLFCLNSCHVDTHNIDLSKLLPSPNFQIKSHDFNLYGICEPCKQKDASN